MQIQYVRTLDTYLLKLSGSEVRRQRRRDNKGLRGCAVCVRSCLHDSHFINIIDDVVARRAVETAVSSRRDVDVAGY